MPLRNRQSADAGTGAGGPETGAGTGVGAGTAAGTGAATGPGTTGTATGGPESPGTMLPTRRGPRSKIERGFVRLVATGGIIGIAVLLGAVLSSNKVAGWIIGLVIGVVTVVLAGLLWSSRLL